MKLKPEKKSDQTITEKNLIHIVIIRGREKNKILLFPYPCMLYTVTQ